MPSFIGTCLCTINHQVLEIIPKQVLRYLSHITGFLACITVHLYSVFLTTADNTTLTDIIPLPWLHTNKQGLDCEGANGLM